jgi:hypothetical protein
LEKLIDKLRKIIDNAVQEDGINADVADKSMLIIAEMKQLNIAKVSNAKHMSCSDYLLHQYCPMYSINGSSACIGCSAAMGGELGERK